MARAIPWSWPPIQLSRATCMGASASGTGLRSPGMRLGCRTMAQYDTQWTRTSAHRHDRADRGSTVRSAMTGDYLRLGVDGQAADRGLARCAA